MAENCSLQLDNAPTASIVGPSEVDTGRRAIERVFRIKICGIRSTDEARMVQQAGADAIGLNFHPASVRYVSPDTAAKIGAEIEGVARVGLFVDAAAAEIQSIVQRVPLDYLQLHGDEPPELIAELPDVPVIKAFRWRDPDLSSIYAYADECQRQQTPLAAVLVDAFVPHAAGGTGHALDWRRLAVSIDRSRSLKLILAGGLDGNNVAAAIRTVRPDAVDCASGVERRRGGGKDRELTRHFVTAAQRAWH